MQPSDGEPGAGRPRGAREIRRALAAWGRLSGRAFVRGSLAFYRGDDLTYAASVAYYALLSLFPFCLLALSILGIVTSGAGRRAAVFTFLFQYFPTHFEFISRQIDALRQMRVRLGIGGAIGMAWAALGVFSAISTAVNHAWGVEKQRSYLQHTIFSFLMLLAAGALLMLALALVSAVEIVHAASFADVVARFPGLQALGGLVVRSATTIMLTAVVGLIYYFVPNARVRFRDVWPGAIVTGLMWHATLALFSLYVSDMGRYRMVHGSIAAVVVFLVWVYTCAVVLLYGAELTAAYARLRAEPRR